MATAGYEQLPHQLTNARGILIKKRGATFPEDLLRIEDETYPTTTKWVRVSSGGYLMVGNQVTPPDADVSAGEVAFFADNTATEPRLRAKLKDASSNTYIVDVANSIRTKYKTADQATTATHTTLVNDTHLTFPIVAGGAYAIEGTLFCFSGATTTGPKIAINGPASPNTVYFQAMGQITQGAAGAASSFWQNAVNSYDAATTLGSGVLGTTAATPTPVTFSGAVVNGVNAGTLALRIAGEANAVITYLKGSWMRVTRVG